MPPTPRVEVSQLSPKQLRKQLKAQGIEVGPILPTTRAIYERKLLECLTGEAPPSPSRYEPVDDDDDDDYEIGGPSEESFVRTASSPVAESPAPGKENFRAPARRRPLHQTSGRGSSSAAPSPSLRESVSTEPEEAGGLPLAAKVCILILVLFIGYLVYMSLEPSTANRIPGRVETEV